MSVEVRNGYPVFTDLEGEPVNEGYIFIGKAGFIPINYPEEVFWDFALKIPAANIRTKNGYAVYEGSPGRLYTKTTHSLLVQDRHKRTIYYQPYSLDIGDPDNPLTPDTNKGNLPLGTILPYNGVLFSGFLKLGTDNLSVITYKDLYELNLDIIKSNQADSFKLLNSGYDTGWVINNSGWKNQKLTVPHNLGKPLSKLNIDFELSESGADNSSVRLLDSSIEFNTSSIQSTGITFYEDDGDNITIQTGEDGVVVIDKSGRSHQLEDETWYYRVTLTRQDLPFEGQIKSTHELPDVSITEGMPIGTIISFPVFDSPDGYLPFNFNNLVLKEPYKLLYDIVGDMYEDQHVEIGDPVPGDDYFYPTPIPGRYGRSALPYIFIASSDVTNDSGSMLIGKSNKFNTDAYYPQGTKLKFEVINGTPPSGLLDGTIIYWNGGTTGNSKVFFSEPDSYNNSNPADFVDAGSGTFRLTQRGLTLDHAMAYHKHSVEAHSDDIIPKNDVLIQLSESQGPSDSLVDSLTGEPETPNLSQENRPVSTLLYYHIKVKTVLDIKTRDEGVLGIKHSLLPDGFIYTVPELEDIPLVKDDEELLLNDNGVDYKITVEELARHPRGRTLDRVTSNNTAFIWNYDSIISSGSGDYRLNILDMLGSRYNIKSYSTGSPAFQVTAREDRVDQTVDIWGRATLPISHGDTLRYIEFFGGSSSLNKIYMVDPLTFQLDVQAFGIKLEAPISFSVKKLLVYDAYVGYNIATGFKFSFVPLSGGSAYSAIISFFLRGSNRIPG